MELKKRPFLLLIRDGWGHNPDPRMHDSNAVELAKTPTEDWLMATYPNTLVASSGEDVGIPAGTMGNSEVGHQNIGAGRIVDQEVLRITKEIREGGFFTNPTLIGVFDHAAKTGGKVHITGLCSDIGVHSILPHLYALLEMARKRNFPGDRVFLHFVGDGRDSPPDRQRTVQPDARGGLPSPAVVPVTAVGPLVLPHSDLDAAEPAPSLPPTAQKGQYEPAGFPKRS